jgi:hypothetical protein
MLIMLVKESYQATIPRSASCDLIGSIITPSVLVLPDNVSFAVVLLLTCGGAYPPTSTPMRRFFGVAIAAKPRTGYLRQKIRQLRKCSQTTIHGC